MLTIAALAMVVAAVTRSYPAEGTAEDPPPEPPSSRHTDAPDASPGPSGTSTTPAAEQQDAPSLKAIRKVLLKQRPIDVLVLGDSSSNGSTEWPALWVTQFTEDRTVRVQQWNADAGNFSGESLEPPSTGPLFTVWNLSQPGVAASYGTRHVTAMPTEPELVLVSYGHFNTPDDIGPQLDALLAKVRDAWPRVPVALILQNPTDDPRARDHATTNAFLRAVWSVQHGVPVIDVESAFRLAGPLPSLLVDGTNPNPAGTAVYVDTVTRALTPGGR